MAGGHDRDADQATDLANAATEVDRSPDDPLAATAVESPRAARQVTDADDSLAADLASLAGLLEAVAATPGAEPVLPRGPFADGAFEIERRLGAGGMGVVYLARDAKLGRHVAIKLTNLRSDQSGFERLLREATAMARLSHRNVISVYEVGTAGDRLFIVMEYMSGGTLRDWLAAGDHSTAEILDVMTEAGEGLAAAHEAGLVHRDFKPDNVFMGEGGRVCVADFGLARAANDIPNHGAAQTSSDSLDLKLTVTGATLGTPAYMAPEQWDGRDVDARADQFAFCVVLHEALYGRHPFGGVTAPELRERVSRGDIDVAGKQRNPPGWLRRIIARGLSAESAERFPSMRALLAAIAAGRQRRRRFAAAGVTAVLLSGVAGVTWAVSAGDDPELCTGAAEHMRGVWDPEVRGAVRAAFAKVDLGFAEPAFERIAAVLDRYRDDWIQLRTETCRATRVRGDQSEELMDLRIACLDRRRNELAGLSRMLVNDPGPEVVASSLEAAYQLSDLGRCEDSRWLRAAYPLPESAELAGRVEKLRTDLGEIDALIDTGQYNAALEPAKSAVAVARTLDYSPVEAEALLLLGRAQQYAAKPDAAETTLREAVGAAARARDDERMARAQIELLRVIGYLKAQPNEALAMRSLVHAAVARAGDPLVLQAEAFKRIGTVYSGMGDNERAREHHARALELAVEEFGPRHPLLRTHLYALALTEYRSGNFEAAEQRFAQSLEIVQSTYGADHPDAAAALHGLALISRKRGDLEGATRKLERAMEISRKVLGEDHPRVAGLLNDLGNLAVEQSRLSDAEELFSNAYEIWSKSLSKGHPNAVRPLINLAEARAAAGQIEQAIRDYQHVMDLLRTAVGADHPKLAQVQAMLGESLSEAGDHKAALHSCRAATLRAEGRFEARAWSCVEKVARELGQRKLVVEARGHLDRMQAEPK